MKFAKIISIVLCAALAGATFAGCKRLENSNTVETADPAASAPRVVYTYGEYEAYRYNALRDNADIIAHVKITDDLTKKNSETFSGKDVAVYDYISERHADVIKMYKNDTGKDFGDTMSVYESAAYTDNGLMINIGETPLQKDNEYIVFLKETSDKRGYCIMSGSTGKINLTNPSQTTNREAEFKFYLDFEANESELINEVISLEAVDGKGKFDEFERLIVPTAFGDMSVAKAVTDNEKHRYIELSIGNKEDGTFRSVTFTNYRFPTE